MSRGGLPRRSRGPTLQVVCAHVLVVEDDATVREVVARYLGEAGHRVELAADGASGLDAAVAHEPDVVVLDVML